MLNLDTHILLLALAGDLTARERRLLATNRWSISATSICCRTYGFGLPVAGMDLRQNLH